MIEVKVKLFGHLRKYLPDDKETEASIQLEEGSAVKDLFNKLELPVDEVKLVYVNNRRVPEEKELNTGDQVGVFPPIAGG